MEYKELNRSCIICGYDKQTLIWDKDTRLKNGVLKCKHIISNGIKMFNSRVVICNRCGFLFTNPQLTEECLNEFYKEEYRNIYSIVPGTPDAHSRSALVTLNALR